MTRLEPRSRNSSGPVATMPPHKQAGQTTVLTKMTANIARKHLQCRSHPQMTMRAPCRLAAVQHRNFDLDGSKLDCSAVSIDCCQPEPDLPAMLRIGDSRPSPRGS